MTSTVVDACTLNNALNVAQLVVLLALLRWVRGADPPPPPARARRQSSSSRKRQQP